MKKSQIMRLVLAALFLAIGYVLPFLTGQIPEIGSMLLPLHLPVLICGFVCGWQWGLLVGFVLPLTRSLLFGMPPIIPTALAMAFEMAAYGAVSGLLYQKLAKRPANVYASLIGAMLAGRVLWGLVSIPIYAMFTQKTFALAAFWVGGFVNAWPGMLLQVVLVPLIVFALERAKLLPIQPEAARVSHAKAN
ncbi:MAG: ECF transporter S component [Clostridia bacterium]